MLAFAPSSSSSSSSSSSPNYAYVPSPLSPRSANIYGLRRHQIQQSPSSYNHMTSNEQHVKSTSRNGANPRDDEENLAQPVAPAAAAAVAVTSSNTTNSSSSSSRIPFSQRPIKRPPLHQFQAPSALQNGRRDAYLRKIALRRAEARFETRGEDMMRWDFMQRQRAWEAERAREAALAASDYLFEDEEYEEEKEEKEVEGVDGGYDGYGLPVASGQMSGLQRSAMASSAMRNVSQEAEVEEFLREEGKELEALLEHLPMTRQEYDDNDDDDDAMNQEEANEFDETSLWSDDADYDALFEEVLSQQEQAGGNAAVAAAAQSSAVISDAQHELVGGDDEMDMS